MFKKLQPLVLRLKWCEGIDEKRDLIRWLRLPRFDAGPPEDERGDVGLFGVARRLRRPESVTRLLLQTVEDRAMVGHFLEPCSELGAFPGFDAGIVQAARDEEGRVGLACDHMLIGVHCVEILEPLRVLDRAEL